MAEFNLKCITNAIDFKVTIKIQKSSGYVKNAVKTLKKLRGKIQVSL